MSRLKMGPRHQPLMPPALGPLMTIESPGTDQEQVLISVGADASWGTPNAVALLAMDADSITVRHVMPWLAPIDERDFTAPCLHTFVLHASWFEQASQLVCLLVYGESTPSAIRLAFIQTRPDLPAQAWLSWPAQWAKPHAQGLCFVVGSCQYPPGLLDAAPDTEQGWAAGPADATFARLAHWRQNDQLPQPAFALLLGDQVYIDATAGLFDPNGTEDRYALPYLKQMQHAWRNLALQNLPVLTLPDDHEFDNDWQPAPHTRCGARAAATLQAGLRQYWRFQRMRPQANLPEGLATPIWRQFTRHGASFFLADTRTERSARTAASIDAARIMGEAQHQALMTWLATEGPKAHPKFLACPSAILPRRQTSRVDRPASALHSDAWDGYPKSLYALLAALCEHQVKQLFLLSGDEHLPSLARITLHKLEHAGQAPDNSPHEPVRVGSIHSSPIYAPFPFANSTPSVLRGDDAFEFSAGTSATNRQHYHCTVQTEFMPGDGLAMVRTLEDASVQCQFVKAGAPPCPPQWVTIS